jgi:hypothetical protein
MAPTWRARARAVCHVCPLERENGAMECPEKRQSGRNSVPPDHARFVGKPYVSFFRYGRKRVFSPYLNRGLGERSTRVREYASTQYASTRVRAREKLVDPVWFDNQGWE